MEKIVSVLKEISKTLKEIRDIRKEAFELDKGIFNLDKNARIKAEQLVESQIKFQEGMKDFMNKDMDIREKLAGKGEQFESDVKKMLGIKDGIDASDLNLDIEDGE